jgi:hypothetical protein
MDPEQNAAMDRLYEGSTLLIAPKGAGKCAMSQTIAQELIEDGELSQVLVLAPLRVCTLTWAQEWTHWEHLYGPGMAIGDPDVREACITNPAHRIVVMNFENVRWFFETFGHDHGFDGLIVDEVTRLQSPGGSTMKALRPYLKDFSWRVTMSATPVAEGGLALYSAALVADKGQCLGRRYDAFKRRYFMQMDFQGRQWDLQPGAQPRLAEALAPILHVMDDVPYKRSLPPLTINWHPVDVLADMGEYYAAMATEALVELEGGETIEAANQAVVSGKLQQLANGAIYDAAGKAVLLSDVKHRQLYRWLEDRPTLVVYQWVFQADMLREMGIPLLADDELLEQKWNEGALPYMAIHPRSAGHGLNLQYGGSRMLVLAPYWSLDAWDQCIGRIWRRGQTSPVTVDVLVGTDTVEEIIVDRLEGKAQNESVLMSHLKSAAAR